MQKKIIMPAKLVAIGMAVSTVVGSTFCQDLNVNATAQKVIDFIFGAIQLGGVTLLPHSLYYTVSIYKTNTNKLRKEI